MARDNEHEAICNIGEIDLGFVLVVLARVAQIFIDRAYESRAHSLIGRAAVFKITRIVVIFLNADRLREAENVVGFKRIFLSVAAVLTACL